MINEPIGVVTPPIDDNIIQSKVLKNKVNQIQRKAHIHKIFIILLQTLARSFSQRRNATFVLVVEYAFVFSGLGF